MNKSAILILLVASSLLIGESLCQVRLITSEFNAETFDSSVLSSWNLASYQGDGVSICGSKSLVGGYNTNLPALVKTFTLSSQQVSSLTVSFDLYLIDKWVSNVSDIIHVSINDNDIVNLGSKFNAGMHSISPNVCGDATKDRVTRIDFTIPFSGTEFTLKIQTKTPEDLLPIWGIRNLNIYSNFDSADLTIAVSELSDPTNFGESNWKSAYPKDALVTNCGTEKILGGFNRPRSQYTRQVNDLPDHTFVIIKLHSVWIDSMDITDSVIFYLDDQIIHEQSRNLAIALKNLCGQAKYKETIQDLEFVVPHTGPTATFKMYLNSDQRAQDESVGFNNFVLATAKPCPILYSDVNAQGQSLQFCGNIPNLKEKGWTVPVKGIYIPKNTSITLYQDSDYNGKSLSLSESNLDLTGKLYVLLNKAFQIEVEPEGKRLRHQSS